MPRKPRIEANDAIYHVINRGNYRSFIFETPGARDAFRNTLFEACERFSWLLSAYCIMGNHFHLCLSTPNGNLSAGMKWLQGTYATRFNRFRRETGHLFQGRFKSLLVEPGEHWLDLVNYIHLNPVRARLCDPEASGKYPWSSLALFTKIRSRPDFLDAAWMDYNERLSDTRNGWNRYKTLLRALSAEDPKLIEELDRRMCRGWCIGSSKYRKAIAKESFGKPDSVRLDREELAELNRTLWENALEVCLKALGKTGKDAREAKYSQDWKLAIALRLKSSTSVSNAWLTEQLGMGTPRSVSAICGKYQKERLKDCGYHRILRKLTFDT